MRIALVILHADAARGGAERYTLDLAQALRQAGQEVTLLAATFGQTPPGVACVELECPSATRLGQYQRFLEALDAHLAKARYDIVHAMLPVRSCDLYHPHAGIAAEAIHIGHEKYRNSLARGLAKVANRYNRKRRRFAEIERELLSGENPPLVLCLSNYIKRAVQKHHAISEDRLVCLLNGVDLQRFDPLARPESRSQTREQLGIASDRVVALMIAQDFERKGLREAIEAVARLRDPRLTLVVVGRDTTPPYRRLAERSGIPKQVVFAGATADPASFYQAADFFVLPTRHDPCSLVVLESLAMGVPVISTVQNGACEAMTDGQEGFVLPDPGDVVRLSTAMRDLLEPTRRKQMREACLALRPRLSQAEHVRRLMELYQSLQLQAPGMRA